MEFPREYLGDGVYASFDGYHVWLHVGRHDMPPAVALEPDVIVRITEYFKRMVEFAKTEDK